VREEYNGILKDIAQNCYEIGVFKYETTYKIMDYIKTKYNDDVEYLWEKFPDNAVARRKDNKKWYLAILTVAKDKLGFEDKGKIEIIDLRVKPDELQELIKNDNIFPAYHMNKKHWITMLLDGSTSLDEIHKRIDESYILAKK
jgi:predicted DNA-binding protein (MmcQ/YjbR family)